LKDLVIKIHNATYTHTGHAAKLAELKSSVTSGERRRGLCVKVHKIPSTKSDHVEQKKPMGILSFACTFLKQDFRINNVEYLLKARTVKPKKEPLLGNASTQQ
jgi:hypothetical protein